MRDAIEDSTALRVRGDVRHDEPPLSSAGRYAGLDGLRGIAALVVVVHHVLLVEPALAQAHRAAPGSLPRWAEIAAYTPLHLVWAGAEAVLVFFVLSGFVLSLGALSDLERTGAGSWFGYYPRRLVRLYLPVVGAVAVALPQAHWLRPDEAQDGASWVYNAHVGSGTLASAGRDVTLAHAHATYLDGPLWSLHWEVLFSLALPAYLLLCRRRTWEAALVGSGMLLLSGLGAARGHEGLEMLPVFGLGAVLAGLARPAQDVARAWWPLLLVGAGALLTSSWSLRAVRPDHVLSKADTGVCAAATALGALLLVLAFVDGPPARWATAVPALRWLGRRSFSLYLVHAPVVISLAFLLGGHPDVLVLMAAALPASLLVAEGFGRLVEDPAHRLSRRVGAAFGSSTTRRAASAP